MDTLLSNLYINNLLESHTMISYLRGDVMKKISLAILLCLIGISLVACEKNENEYEDIEKHTSESPYEFDYIPQIEVIKEIYYDYNNVFAGVYLIDGEYNINITEDTPQIMITKLEQNSLVTHHIVKFSFAELWTIQEIVASNVIEIDEPYGIGISVMDNSVTLTLNTDTVIPTSLYHYIEIGILTIRFSDLEERNAF